ncbi:hypothetical protein CaCOL14_007996 [Colletotrichum acutatum]
MLVSLIDRRLRAEDRDVLKDGTCWSSGVLDGKPQLECSSIFDRPKQCRIREEKYSRYIRTSCLKVYGRRCIITTGSQTSGINILPIDYLSTHPQNGPIQSDRRPKGFARQRSRGCKRSPDTRLCRLL